MFDNGLMSAVTAQPPGIQSLDVQPPDVQSQPRNVMITDLRGAVRAGRDVGAGGGVLPDADLLIVLPALRDLLQGGGVRRGCVVAAGGWGFLWLALVEGPVAAGAWCAVAGVPQAGLAAAADVGLDLAGTLLVSELGQKWPQVVAS